jgi:hypothetical protein
MEALLVHPARRPSRGEYLHQIRSLDLFRDGSKVVEFVA